MSAKSSKSKTCGVPDAGIGSADNLSFDSITDCVSEGFFSSINAATDATCGVAIDVPPT